MALDAAHTDALLAQFQQEQGFRAERVEVTGEYLFYYAGSNKYSGLLSRKALKRGSLKKEY